MIHFKKITSIQLEKTGPKDICIIRKKDSWFSVFIRDIIRDRQLYLLLIPVVIYYILFQYKPLYGLQIAFKDYSPFKGIENSTWVGFKHFITFFEGPYFARTLRNNLVISLYGLIFGFPAPIFLALLLNEVRNKHFKKTIQTISYLPYFISAVIVAGLVTNFLSPTNGLINIIISKLGGEKIYFLTKPQYFRTIYTLMNIWKETGFNAIIYIAALAGIDMQLYEAAYMDGANRFRRLWHITMPGILPTIMIMFIIKMGLFLDVGYESIILLYQPATYETADIINTYVYRSGIAEGHYDVAAAIGIMNGVVALILVSVSNFIGKKVTDYGIW